MTVQRRKQNPNIAFGVLSLNGLKSRRNRFLLFCTESCALRFKSGALPHILRLMPIS